jgi:hypothetical protein
MLFFVAEKNKEEGEDMEMRCPLMKEVAAARFSSSVLAAGGGERRSRSFVRRRLAERVLFCFALFCFAARL